MILQTAPPTGFLPLIPIAFILSIWGGIADWRYKRRGGKKPTKRQRVFFAIALCLVAASLFVMVVLGGSQGPGPEMAGHLAAPMPFVFLAIWELIRWNVRLKNPLPPPPEG
jgi:peptidoglycan/LPS O-acetylase OafA/YrhL